MPNGNSPSGEAVEMPAPATSQVGWAGRCGPECPKGNLSELTWASKPDCGIATMRKTLT